MNIGTFIPIAAELDIAGLLWQPEIGDEVSTRVNPEHISILVDPQGLRPDELREIYVWLPSVEQMVFQIEARQALLFHAGLEMDPDSFGFKAIIRAREGQIEHSAESLRTALGLSLIHI